MNKENAIETIDYKGHKIGLFYDQDPESPREWDNLGTIYSNSKRYSPDGKGIEELMEMAGQSRYDEAIDFKAIRKKFYCLKIWIYDHSGQTVRTGETNPWGNMGYMSWDSGLFGAIAVSKEKAKKEYGYKRACKGLEKKVLSCLEAEVKTFDCFVTGEIYSYVVENEQGEEIDSCCGWYDREEAINEAKGMVDYVVDKKVN